MNMEEIYKMAVADAENSTRWAKEAFAAAVTKVTRAERVRDKAMHDYLRLLAAEKEIAVKLARIKAVNTMRESR